MTINLGEISKNHTVAYDIVLSKILSGNKSVHNELKNFCTEIIRSGECSYGIPLFYTSFLIAILNEVSHDNPNSAVALDGDRGGLTKYGVASAHVDYSTKEEREEFVRNLTLLQASVYYYENYWCKVFDEKKTTNIPDDIAIVVFLYGINTGMFRAISLLKNVVSSSMKDDWDATVKKTNDFVNVVGSRSIIVKYYEQQKVQRKTFSGYGRFGNGWNSRDLRVVDTVFSIFK